MAKTYVNLYSQTINLKNLILAWRKARKHKTKKAYVIEFEANLRENLLKLQEELENQTYKPEPLVNFVIKDPKTRKISKSAFRDRIVHHAIIKIIEPIFDKTFIYDSCANRIGKGNLFAIKRFEKFVNKVSRNGKINGWFNNNQIKGYCLKADIKHYFQEVNHKVLISILRKKLCDEKVISLIEKILKNSSNKMGERGLCKKGMPLGNLTSQFFANVYLNELDYFVKHKLKAKYYIRYVDDFVILHNSKEQLKIWKQEIDNFLRNELKLELHPEKSKIIPLSRGVDFVGFRNFYYYRLLRKRNIKSIYFKIERFKLGIIDYEKILESFQGWNAYAKWANSFKLRKEVVKNILYLQKYCSNNTCKYYD
jgi:RNA-directed DNA polymerase